MQFTTEDLLIRHKTVVHPSDNRMEAELLLSLLDRISQEKETSPQNTEATAPIHPVESDSQSSAMSAQGNTVTCFQDASSLESHTATCIPQSGGESQMESSMMVPQSAKSPTAKKARRSGTC